MKQFFFILPLLLASISASASETITPPMPPSIPTAPILPKAASSMITPIAGGLDTYSQGLPLSEFLRVNLSDILGKPFVITPSALADNPRINADLKTVNPSKLFTVLKSVLDTAGYSLQEVQGVSIIQKKSDKQLSYNPDDVTDVYFPEHQPISTFQILANSYPDLKFNGSNASISNIGNSLHSSSSANSSTPSAQQTAPVSSLSSASTARFFSITGNPSRIKSFLKLCKSVDLKPSQVRISAYVLETYLTDSNQDGISLVSNLFNGGLGLNSSTGSVSIKTSLLKGSLAGDFALNIQNVLASSSVRVLYAPTTVLYDSGRATFTTGQKIPVQTGTLTTDNKAVTSSIAYQQVGLTLDVSATIYENSIALQVSQELSTFSESSFSGSPIISNKSFSNPVTVTDKDTLVIGGLRSESESNSKTKSFWLFNSKSVTNAKTDIVVLLHAERI